MRICSFFLIMLLAFPASATDKSGNFAVWGVGSSSCIKYTQSRTANDADKYRQFLMGYLTAYNHQADETYSISSAMTMDEILKWFDDECELKPTSSFDQAVMDFIIEHNAKRSKYPSGSFGR